MAENGSRDGWFCPHIGPLSLTDNIGFGFIVNMDKMLKRERKEALELARGLVKDVS